MKNHGNKGKKRSEEANQKNRIAHLGVKSNKKGKTNIELYGEEKAAKIKEKFINSHGNDWRKGKTYEEMYGEEKAIEMKENAKSRFIGNNNPNYGKSSKRKGKTYEEIFGKEKASEISKKKEEYLIVKVKHTKKYLVRKKQ